MRLLVQTFVIRGSNIIEFPEQQGFILILQWSSYLKSYCCVVEQPDFALLTANVCFCIIFQDAYFIVFDYEWV